EDAGGAEGGDHVTRDLDALRLEVPVEGAEQQVEHQRERQGGDAVHRQPEQLEELELRLAGDELEYVAARGGGGKRGFCGYRGHAGTPCELLVEIDVGGGFLWLLVMARNASSSEAPVTSSPRRSRSAARSSRTVASAS